MIRQAAELGGAKHFIEQLPNGFATYLDPPVQDYYSGIPQGTKTLFGKPVDYNRIRGTGSLTNVASTGLSGGQMQRLALYVNKAQ
jgi:ABC-type multidrug transport system fused ATPase/permease subunit